MMKKIAEFAGIRVVFRGLAAGWLLAGLLLPAAFSQTTPGDPAARSYDQRGLDLLNRHDYDPAITNFTAAIRLDPADAYAYNCRGLARSEQNDIDGAIADFRHAAALAPGYANIYLNSGWLLLSKKHDLHAAIMDFNEAIRLDPTNADYHLTRAGAWIVQTNFFNALADYNLAAELQPTASTVYLARANFFCQQTNFILAANDYDAALQLEPATMAQFFYLNHPSLLKCATNFDEVSRYFNAALENQPSNLGFHYLRGGFLLCQETNYELAAADFSECIQAQSSNAWLYASRADAEESEAGLIPRGVEPARQGHLDGALQDRRQAAALDPKFLVRLARLECKLGSVEPGIIDLNKYVQTYPDRVEGWDTRGAAYELAAIGYARQGDTNREDNARQLAVSDWNHLAALDTNLTAFIDCSLGDLSARTGQYAGALKYFHHALDLAPNDRNTMLSLAWFLAACPDPAWRDGKQARSIAQKICANGGSEDGANLACLAAAQAETGDFDGAVKNQRRALAAMSSEWADEESTLPGFRREMRHRLAYYEEKEPCHELVGLTLFE